MNLFTNLLSLHDNLRDAFADPPRSYAQGYGNKVAARNAFPPLRGAPARQVRRAFAPAPAALVPCGCR